MTLVSQSYITEVYRALHEAAYDLYEQHGPLIEDDLGEFPEIALPRLMPILEELAREREYRAKVYAERGGEG